jgi:hypothetical protein
MSRNHVLEDWQRDKRRQVRSKVIFVALMCTPPILCLATMVL